MSLKSHRSGLKPKATEKRVPRYPFFYGWVILATCVISMICSLPGQTVGVGVFTPNLQQTLGLTTVQISAAFMAGTICASFGMPFLGRFLMRLGARRFGSISFLSFGVVLILLSYIGHLHQWISRYAGEIPLVGIGILIAGFFGLRLFGQGALPVLSHTLIGLWFERRRGFASAINSFFVSVGFAFAPMILYSLGDRLGWETAWRSIGLLYLCFGSVMAWLLLRDSPESVGMVPDGKQNPRLTQEQRDMWKNYRHFRVKEVLRTFPFWVFVIGIGSNALFGTAVVFHMVPISLEAGMTTDAFLRLFPFMAAFNVCSSFISGWIADHYDPKYALALMACSQLCGQVGLLCFPHPVAQFFYVAGTGASWGCFSVLLTTVWPKYYGRKYLGNINSIVSSLMVFTSSVGPILFSLSNAITGQFLYGIALTIIFPVTVLLCIPLIRSPQLQAAKKLPSEEKNDTKKL